MGVKMKFTEYLDQQDHFSFIIQDLILLAISRLVPMAKSDFLGPVSDK